MKPLFSRRRLFITGIFSLLAGAVITFIITRLFAGSFFINPNTIQAFNYVQFAPPSPRTAEPVPDAINWVRSFKKIYPTRSYFFNIPLDDIKHFSDSSKFAGLRIYLGLKTESDHNTVSLIMAGIKDKIDGDDFYYIDPKGNEMIMDDMTHCPPPAGCPPVGTKLLGN